MSPRVQSIAVAGRAAAAIHVLPFAVCDEAGTIAQAPCTPITIKYSPQDAGTNSCGVDSTSANFGVLRLGDNTGSDDYRDTVVNRYGGTLRVGDCVSTETGNMNGPTKQAVLERIAGIPPYVCTVNPPSPPPKNARMIILPKVSNLNVNGSGQVCITGFYVAVLDSVDDKANVQARFLSVFASDQVDPGTTMTPGVLSGVGLVK